MYPQHPSYTTHARSRTHSTPDHPTAYNPQVQYSCLPMFLIYQPEDGQWKGPKHVVVLYVINYTYLYHHTVVLDRYTNSNLVYYKHNGDDEPFDLFTPVSNTLVFHIGKTDLQKSTWVKYFFHKSARVVIFHFLYQQNAHSFFVPTKPSIMTC